MRIREYLVCYFDLLGQRDGLLKQIRENAISEEVLSQVEQVSNAICRFNHAIATVVKLIHEHPEKLLGILNIPKEAWPVLIDNLKECSSGIQQFSDTTIFYVSTENDIWIGIFIAWCRELAVHIIDLTSEHILIRGGIAIGKGWEIEPNCLYGPVLEDVYSLESKYAIYPRITISEKAYERLLAALNPADNRLETNQLLVQECQTLTTLFATDFDGLRILDYLSIAVLRWFEVYLDRDKLKGLVISCLDFILKEYDEIVSVVPARQEKARIALKHTLLRSYWLQRWNTLKQYFDSGMMQEGQTSLAGRMEESVHELQQEELKQ